MSNKTEIGPQEDPPPKLEFSPSSIGTMFTTSQFIIILLSLEEISDRAGILADICKTMKISPRDIADEYNDEACSKCGYSLLRHRETHGVCP